MLTALCETPPLYMGCSKQDSPFVFFFLSITEIQRDRHSCTHFIGEKLQMQIYLKTNKQTDLQIK